jgi:hypothetical protein
VELQVLAAPLPLRVQAVKEPEPVVERAIVPVGLDLFGAPESPTVTVHVML